MLTVLRPLLFAKHGTLAAEQPAFSDFGIGGNNAFGQFPGDRVLPFLDPKQDLRTCISQCLGELGGCKFAPPDHGMQPLPIGIGFCWHGCSDYIIKEREQIYIIHSNEALANPNKIDSAIMLTPRRRKHQPCPLLVLHKTAKFHLKGSKAMLFGLLYVAILADCDTNITLF